MISLPFKWSMKSKLMLTHLFGKYPYFWDSLNIMWILSLLFKFVKTFMLILDTRGRCFVRTQHELECHSSADCQCTKSKPKTLPPKMWLGLLQNFTWQHNKLRELTFEKMRNTVNVCTMTHYNVASETAVTDLLMNMLIAISVWIEKCCKRITHSQLFDN